MFENAKANAAEVDFLNRKVTMKMMLKSIVIAAAMGLSATSAIAADAPAPAAAVAFSTTETDIGTLIDTPETKAILDKLLPGLTTNDQISMARPMTLRAVQQFAPDKIKSEVLDQIDLELAKLKTK
jgi:ABC-type proline/glycine betaine transport system substrate-binding protein